MRSLPALLFAVALTLLSALPASGHEEPPSAQFGQAGAPRFDTYPLPDELANAHGSGEPTIGIPWNTDHAFFQAFSSTHKAVFDDTQLDAQGRAKVEWTDVTPAFTLTNVDPMLHADTVTGRVWAGGLAGPCSLMGVTDDDGATWVPAANMCSGAQFDHQSIGSGPWSASSPDSVARALVSPRAVYYCAQLQLTACATSLDGGITFLPPNEVTGGCGGLHGHIEVSEITGTAVVPHGGCSAQGEGPPAVFPNGNYVGFAYTDNNGAVWSSRAMPDSRDGNGGFDPAVAFSTESGWLWLAQADQEGIHIAMSKDEGLTWELLGNSTEGAFPSTWLSLNGTFHDPVTGNGLKFGTFADLEAGDDERVAFAYMATTNPDGKSPFNDCGNASDGNVWHYYLSVSYDGGSTFTTTRLSEDPVQVGAIWDGGGGDPCRNLLDFNDMEMDSKGRLHIAFADGCTAGCAEKYAAGEEVKGGDSRDSLGTILRQATGRGMFAQYDVASPPPPPPPPGPLPQPSPDVPATGLVAMLGLMAFALRRKASA